MRSRRQVVPRLAYDGGDGDPSLAWGGYGPRAVGLSYAGA